MMNRSANTSRVELNDTYKDLSAKMHMNSYNNRVCGDLQNRPSMGRDIYPNNSCSIEQLNRWHSIAYKNFNAGINTNADVRKSESATAHNTNIFDNSSYNTGANLGSMDQPGGNYNICISNVDVSNSVSRYLDYNMHSMGHNIKNNGNSNSSTAYNSAANSKLNFTKYSYTNLLNNANNNINSRTSISKCL